MLGALSWEPGWLWVGREGGAAPFLASSSPQVGGAVPSQHWMRKGEGGYVGWIWVLWAPGAMAETHFVGGGRGGLLCPPPSVTIVGGHGHILRASCADPQAAKASAPKRKIHVELPSLCSPSSSPSSTSPFSAAKGFQVLGNQTTKQIHKQTKKQERGREKEGRVLGKVVLAYNSQEVLHRDWQAEEMGDSSDCGNLWPLELAQGPPPPSDFFTPFFTPPSPHH